MCGYFEEERIIKYYLPSEVPGIIATFISNQFLFVEHSPKNKTLRFKKCNHPLELSQGVEE